MHEFISKAKANMDPLFFAIVVIVCLIAILPFFSYEILPVLAITCLGVAFLFLFVRFSIPFDDFRNILILCICSFLLRAFLTVIIDPSVTSFFKGIWQKHPDNFAYDRLGWHLAQGWKLGNFVGLSTSKSGYFYLVGAIYFIFGHTMPGAKTINGLIGALTIIFIYLLTREIYGRKPALTASLLVGFFPSLVLWSAMLLKDTLAIFLITLSVWSTIRLHNEFRVRYIMILVLSLAYYMQIRYYVVPFIVAVVLSSFLVRSGQRLVRNILLAFLLLLCLAAAWRYFPGSSKGAYSDYSIDLATANAVRAGFAGGGSKFLGDVRIKSYTQALKFLPLGLVYFFFGPFPWQVRGLTQMITVPEVLLWYCLSPFMIYGLVYTFRYKFSKAFVIVALAVLLTLIYTFGITNMGSLYRYRAQAFIFYLIFAAVGIAIRRDRRLGIAGSS